MSTPGLPEGLTEAVMAALGIHRWKSMGLNSVECECGTVVSGTSLTEGAFPADEAFRRHLTGAMLGIAAPVIAAQAAAAERERIIALAERHNAVADPCYDGIEFADLLRQDGDSDQKASVQP